MYADENGLYLQVYATGKKAFLLRRQSGGKQKKEVLGHYPAMGLAEARAAVKRAKSGVVSKTLQEAFDLYYVGLKKDFRDPAQTKRMMERDVLSKLGKSELTALKRQDYTDILQRVVDRGSPVMANRLLVQTSRFLGYCEQKGWLEENPLERVSRRAVGGREKSRERALSWDEISSLLEYLTSDSHKTRAGTRWALLGDLLTGQRATEVLRMEDTGLPWLEGPAKTSPYKVPLTPLVRLWMRLKPDRVPSSHVVMARAVLTAGFTFTPHDLRRTFASRLADLGVMPHVIEKMLNHKMEGVMAVYNRAEFWNERVAAQRLWDHKLLELYKKLPRSLSSTGRTRRG